ncbi:MAG: beta-N-acetylhexosaminidase [Bacillota bacterium]
MKMNEIIETMSIEEKVGQLFQVGFTDIKVNEEIKDMIKNYHIGGVIYFSRNIKNPEQVVNLSKNLQSLSINSGRNIPLFISIDQEGGTVTRLKGTTHFPGNMTLGATRNKKLVKKAAKATGNELKNLGINMNLAPVLDINNNSNNPVIGVRSFGGDEKLVAKLGSEYIKSLQGESVIACAKHFPGHGDTDTDSHLNLPVINHSRDRLNNIELIPFKEAIKIGVDSIMTAHIYFPTIEKEIGVPATLSRKVLTGLLREELGYDGLIITDCMEMNAISDSYGTVEGAVRSIVAGSDIVLISHSYEKQKKAIKATIAAVKANRISEKRINESLNRILKLKKKRIGFDKPIEPDYKEINFSKNKTISKKIAEKGVTLIKGEDIIPVNNIEKKNIAVIDFNMGRVSLVEDEKNHDNLFIDFLSTKVGNLETLNLDSKENLTDKQKNELKNKDLIIVCTYNGVKNRKQLNLADKLAEEHKVVVLALRNPYDYKFLEKVQGFITTYDYSPANQKAAAALITGEIKARGQLPVVVRDEKNEK